MTREQRRRLLLRAFSAGKRFTKKAEAEPYFKSASDAFVAGWLLGYRARRRDSTHTLRVMDGGTLKVVDKVAIITIGPGGGGSSGPAPPAPCKGGQWQQEPDESRWHCSECGEYIHRHGIK